MWIAVWSVLAIGAVAVPALLVLRLWRRVTAIGRDFAATSEAVALRHPGGAEPERARPTLLDPRATLRARERRRANRDARTARRQAVLGRARARWTASGLA